MASLRIGGGTVPVELYRYLAASRASTCQGTKGIQGRQDAKPMKQTKTKDAKPMKQTMIVFGKTVGIGVEGCAPLSVIPPVFVPPQHGSLGQLVADMEVFTRNDDDDDAEEEESSEESESEESEGE